VAAARTITILKITIRPVCVFFAFITAFLQLAFYSCDRNEYGNIGNSVAPEPEGSSPYS
jgi:hypothetical protein